jgi:protein-S-isoprenylcysteine O-methyltransferase Ste14
MIPAGVFLICCGLAVRWVAARSLGGLFTWRVIPPERMVDRGMYKHIRHPLYSGGWLVFCGVAAVLTRDAGITALSGFAAAHWVMDRADREEQMMLDKFGMRYVDYMKRTKMFVPFLF